MANVKHPLFSLEAHGTIGTNFYFRERRKGNFIFSHYWPKEIPQTEKQHFFRRLFGEVAELWRIETNSTVEEYRQKALITNLTSFNIYYKELFLMLYNTELNVSQLGILSLGDVS